MVWDIDPVFIHLPFIGLEVRYYGLLFALTFVLGFYMFRWQILKHNGTEQDAYDIIIPAAIGVVVGARLGHIIFYDLDIFLKNPIWFFKVYEGGLASHGAMAGLLIVLFYYSRTHKRPFLNTFDCFVFSIAIGATLVRIGNFFNSEIVGKIAFNSSFAIKFPRHDLLPLDLVPMRYPVQLVEAFYSFLILIILLLVDKFLDRKKYSSGLLTGLFIFLYSVCRFFVEFIKERQGLSDVHFLSMGQILSLPGLILGFIIIIYWYRTNFKSSIKN